MTGCKILFSINKAFLVVITEFEYGVKNLYQQDRVMVCLFMFLVKGYLSVFI